MQKVMLVVTGQSEQTDKQLARSSCPQSLGLPPCAYRKVGFGRTGDEAPVPGRRLDRSSDARTPAPGGGGSRDPERHHGRAAAAEGGCNYWAFRHPLLLKHPPSSKGNDTI